jgi:hypothetical protein
MVSRNLGDNPDPRDILSLNVQEATINFDKINQVNFEADCVTSVLKSIGRSSLKHHLLKKCEHNCGERKLRFLELCDYFYKMPYIVARSLRKSERKSSNADSLYKLFTRFEERVLYKEFESHASDIPQEFAGRHLGVVVNWPHIKSGLLIHDYNVQHLDGVHITFTSGDLVLYVEPLSQFVARTSDYWNQEE